MLNTSFKKILTVLVNIIVRMASRLMRKKKTDRLTGMLFY